MTDLETVIREAAIKNHLALKVDDPVMVLVTIMNRIVEDQTEAMKAALTGYREAQEDIAHRWRNDATTAAETILNAALDAGREAMAKGMSEGAAQVLTLMREEHERLMAQEIAFLRASAERYGKHTRWLGFCNLTALASVVIAVILWAVKALT